MAEQAVLRVHRMRRAISGSSAAVVRPAVWLLGPPLLLGLLAALIAMQLEGQARRSKAEVVFRVQPLGPEYMEMQAKLARSQDLASRVVVEAGVPGMTAKRFLRHSSASPPSDTGPPPVVCTDLPCGPLETKILTLSVSDRRSAAAVRLTNVYATEFVRLRRELDGRQIQKALASIHAVMMPLRARGQTNTPRYQALAQQEGQLRTLWVQFVRNTATPRTAERPFSFRPHVLRNGLLGGLLGVLLGVAVAVGIAKRRA
jgi:hypothetical protein